MGTLDDPKTSYPQAFPQLVSNCVARLQGQSREFGNKKCLHSVVRLIHRLVTRRVQHPSSGSTAAQDRQVQRIQW